MDISILIDSREFNKTKRARGSGNFFIHEHRNMTLINQT